MTSDERSIAKVALKAIMDTIAFSVEPGSDHIVDAAIKLQNMLLDDKTPDYAHMDNAAHVQQTAPAPAYEPSVGYVVISIKSLEAYRKLVDGVTSWVDGAAIVDLRAALVAIKESDTSAYAKYVDRVKAPPPGCHWVTDKEWAAAMNTIGEARKLCKVNTLSSATEDLRRSLELFDRS